jgi:hypothetical protein
MRSIMGKVLISLAIVGLLGELVWAGRLSWQVYGPGGWRDEMQSLAASKGSRQAMDDFKKGHFRIYVLGGESDESHSTGKKDGVFEIWAPQYFPSLGPAHRYATEQFVEFYNRRMRYMHSHPEKFPKKEEAKQTDGAAISDAPVDDAILAYLATTERHWRKVATVFGRVTEALGKKFPGEQAGHELFDRRIEAL